MRLKVEKYGGMLLAPWFDRPLSVAGRILVRDGEDIRSILVDLDKDVAVIPSLAIHMNREANKGYSYKEHLQRLFIRTGYREAEVRRTASGGSL